MNTLSHRAIAELPSLICSQQATLHEAAQSVGCFKMKAGCAMSLAPRTAGELQIAHGQVWVTLGDAANDITALAGDHFLGTGDKLRLMPGQHVVMQGYANTANGSVYFSWEPDAAANRATLSRSVRQTRPPVRQPLRDLGLALHQAGNALGRLVQGVAACLVDAVVPDRNPAPGINHH